MNTTSLAALAASFFMLACSTEVTTVGSGGGTSAGGQGGSSVGVGGTDGGGSGGGGTDAVPPPGPVPDEVPCEAPHVNEEISVSMSPSGGCANVTEGRILAIHAAESGSVSFDLHQGFDGGSSVDCTVTVSNTGVELASELQWAVGTTYAGWIVEGTPGALWLGDGVNWSSCDTPGGGFSVYPLVLWAGGDPSDNHQPPIYTGSHVEPHWGGTLCHRDVGDCTQYELGFTAGHTDESCELRDVVARVGETADFELGGRTHKFHVRKAYNQTECPVPGQPDVSTNEQGTASWVFWATE